MKAKLSDKQLVLLRKLYVEQRKNLDENAENWLKNLPPDKASELIDIWITKNRRRNNR